MMKIDANLVDVAEKAAIADPERHAKPTLLIRVPLPGPHCHLDSVAADLGSWNVLELATPAHHLVSFDSVRLMHRDDTVYYQTSIPWVRSATLFAGKSNSRAGRTDHQVAREPQQTT